MAHTLSAHVLSRYRRFTLYNSPYVAHEQGCAVDLYPGDAIDPDPVDGPPVDAPSPVAGEVLATRTVTAPSQPYAAENDHLVVIDTGDALGRLMHVAPAIEPGDRVELGDSLGTLVRAGYFAPWVANHIHLGFRPPDADPVRASGSVPLELDSATRLEPVDWDGTGTVIAAGDTYAVLDGPAHPAPGDAFAGLAATDSEGTLRGVLDGGLPHYEDGGVLSTARSPGDTPAGTVHLLDTPIGRVEGRDVVWDDLCVLANGEPVRGIALAPTRDDLLVKLVGEGVDLSVGETVTVDIVRT